MNLVFVSLDLDRKTKKLKVKSHFVKRKHCEGIYLLCELRSAYLSDSLVKCKSMTKVRD